MKTEKAVEAFTAKTVSMQLFSRLSLPASLPFLPRAALLCALLMLGAAAPLSQTRAQTVEVKDLKLHILPAAVDASKRRAETNLVITAASVTGGEATVSLSARDVTEGVDSGDRLPSTRFSFVPAEVTLFVSDATQQHTVEFTYDSGTDGDGELTTTTHVIDLTATSPGGAPDTEQLSLVDVDALLEGLRSGVGSLPVLRHYLKFSGEAPYAAGSTFAVSVFWSWENTARADFILLLRRNPGMARTALEEIAAATGLFNTFFTVNAYAYTLNWSGDVSLQNSKGAVSDFFKDSRTTQNITTDDGSFQLSVPFEEVTGLSCNNQFDTGCQNQEMAELVFLVDPDAGGRSAFFYPTSAVFTLRRAVDTERHFNQDLIDALTLFDPPVTGVQVGEAVGQLGLTLTLTDDALPETGGMATLTVSVTGSLPDGGITVNLSVSDDHDSDADADLMLSEASVTLTETQRSREVRVTAVDEDDPEPQEMMTISAAATAAGETETDEADVTIGWNDYAVAELALEDVFGAPLTQTTQNHSFGVRVRLNAPAPDGLNIELSARLAGAGVPELSDIVIPSGQQVDQTDWRGGLPTVGNWVVSVISNPGPAFNFPTPGVDEAVAAVTAQAQDLQIVADDGEAPDPDPTPDPTPDPDPMPDPDPPPPGPTRPPLSVTALTLHGGTAPDVYPPSPRETGQTVIAYVTLNEAAPTTVQASVRWLRPNSSFVLLAVEIPPGATQNAISATAANLQPGGTHVFSVEEAFFVDSPAGQFEILAATQTVEVYPRDGYALHVEILGKDGRPVTEMAEGSTATLAVWRMGQVPHLTHENDHVRGVFTVQQEDPDPDPAELLFDPAEFTDIRTPGIATRTAHAERAWEVTAMRRNVRRLVTTDIVVQGVPLVESRVFEEEPTERPVITAVEDMTPEMRKTVTIRSHLTRSRDTGFRVSRNSTIDIPRHGWEVTGLTLSEQRPLQGDEVTAEVSLNEVVPPRGSDNRRPAVRVTLGLREVGGTTVLWTSERGIPSRRQAATAALPTAGLNVGAFYEVFVQSARFVEPAVGSDQPTPELSAQAMSFEVGPPPPVLHAALENSVLAEGTTTTLAVRVTGLAPHGETTLAVTVALSESDGNGTDDFVLEGLAEDGMLTLTDDATLTFTLRAIADAEIESRETLQIEISAPDSPEVEPVMTGAAIPGNGYTVTALTLYGGDDPADNYPPSPRQADQSVSAVVTLNAAVTAIARALVRWLRPDNSSTVLTVNIPPGETAAPASTPDLEQAGAHVFWVEEAFFVDSPDHPFEILSESQSVQVYSEYDLHAELLDGDGELVTEMAEGSTASLAVYLLNPPSRDDGNDLGRVIFKVGQDPALRTTELLFNSNTSATFTNLIFPGRTTRMADPERVWELTALGTFTPGTGERGQVERPVVTAVQDLMAEARERVGIELEIGRVIGLGLQEIPLVDDLEVDIPRHDWAVTGLALPASPTPLGDEATVEAGLNAEMPDSEKAHVTLGLRRAGETAVLAMKSVTISGARTATTTLPLEGFDIGDVFEVFAQTATFDNPAIGADQPTPEVTVLPSTSSVGPPALTLLLSLAPFSAPHRAGEELEVNMRLSIEAPAALRASVRWLRPDSSSETLTIEILQGQHQSAGAGAGRAPNLQEGVHTFWIESAAYTSSDPALQGFDIDDARQTTRVYGPLSLEIALLDRNGAPVTELAEGATATLTITVLNVLRGGREEPMTVDQFLEDGTDSRELLFEADNFDTVSAGAQQRRLVVEFSGAPFVRLGPLTALVTAVEDGEPEPREAVEIVAEIVSAGVRVSLDAAIARDGDYVEMTPPTPPTPPAAGLRITETQPYQLSFAWSAALDQRMEGGPVEPLTSTGNYRILYAEPVSGACPAEDDTGYARATNAMVTPGADPAADGFTAVAADTFDGSAKIAAATAYCFVLEVTDGVNPVRTAPISAMTLEYSPADNDDDGLPDHLAPLCSSCAAADGEEDGDNDGINDALEAYLAEDAGVDVKRSDAHSDANDNDIPDILELHYGAIDGRTAKPESDAVACRASAWQTPAGACQDENGNGPAGMRLLIEMNTEGEGVYTGGGRVHEDSHDGSLGEGVLADANTWLGSGTHWLMGAGQRLMRLDIRPLLSLIGPAEVAAAPDVRTNVMYPAEVRLQGPPALSDDEFALEFQTRPPAHQGATAAPEAFTITAADRVRQLSVTLPMLTDDNNGDVLRLTAVPVDANAATMSLSRRSFDDTTTAVSLRPWLSTVRLLDSTPPTTSHAIIPYLADPVSGDRIGSAALPAAGDDAHWFVGADPGVDAVEFSCVGVPGVAAEPLPGAPPVSNFIQFALPAADRTDPDPDDPPVPAHAYFYDTDTLTLADNSTRALTAADCGAEEASADLLGELKFLVFPAGSEDEDRDGNLVPDSLEGGPRGGPADSGAAGLRYEVADGTAYYLRSPGRGLRLGEDAADQGFGTPNLIESDTVGPADLTPPIPDILTVTDNLVLDFEAYCADRPDCIMQAGALTQFVFQVSVDIPPEIQYYTRADAGWCPMNADYSDNALPPLPSASLDCPEPHQAGLRDGLGFAAPDADDVCPPLGSAEYAPAGGPGPWLDVPQAGDRCVQLSITNNDSNDRSDFSNIISASGFLGVERGAGIGDNPEIEIYTDGYGGGGGSMGLPALLLLGLLTLLSLFAVRRAGFSALRTLPAVVGALLLALAPTQAQAQEPAWLPDAVSAAGGATFLDPDTASAFEVDDDEDTGWRLGVEWLWRDGVQLLPALPASDLFVELSYADLGEATVCLDTGCTDDSEHEVEYEIWSLGVRSVWDWSHELAPWLGKPFAGVGYRYGRSNEDMGEKNGAYWNAGFEWELGRTAAERGFSLRVFYEAYDADAGAVWAGLAWHPRTERRVAADKPRRPRVERERVERRPAERRRAPTLMDGQCPVSVEDACACLEPVGRSPAGWYVQVIAYSQRAQAQQMRDRLAREGLRRLGLRTLSGSRGVVHAVRVASPRSCSAAMEIKERVDGMLEVNALVRPWYQSPW